MNKTGTKENRGGWLKDPQKPREGEVIGGGFFVFRRGDGTNRIRPSIWPFEYASAEAACEEAARLAHVFRGMKFDVYGHYATCVAPADALASKMEEQTV